jgi:aerobic carbon-monoxide dehydrogenase small subunit
MTGMLVSFRLNGRMCDISAEPKLRLSTILREIEGLTATKVACGIGRCGSCMVLMNGEAVNSCLVMAYQLDGAEVVSPEGLDAIPEAATVRQALIDEVSFQCGYCAPGVSVALTALLRSHPQASETEIRAALEGNICRCTGYHSILRGALEAARRLSQ